jgi:hypothetical protein
VQVKVGPVLHGLAHVTVLSAESIRALALPERQGWEAFVPTGDRSNDLRRAALNPPAVTWREARRIWTRDPSRWEGAQE